MYVIFTWIVALLESFIDLITAKQHLHHITYTCIRTNVINSELSDTMSMMTKAVCIKITETCDDAVSLNSTVCGKCVSITTCTRTTQRESLFYSDKLPLRVNQPNL